MLFKSYSLIVDETYPDVSLLQRIADQGVQRTNSKDFSYKYSIRFEEGRFLLLAVDFDHFYTGEIAPMRSMGSESFPSVRGCQQKQLLF